MAEHRLRLSDGADILLRRTGNPEGPRLLVSHGTGFAVDGFARMWQPLAATCDLVLFDLRGHGRNGAVAPQSVDAERLMRDMAEIVTACHEHFGARPCFGLFHSISALMALRLESVSPGSFAGLVLIEPPATPPAGDPRFDAFEEGRMALASRSARRQARFGAVAELAGKFTARGPFRFFEPGAAEELAAAMLVPDGEGWKLACPPEVEAACFARNLDDGLRRRLKDIGCPVLMLVGREDLAIDGTPACIALHLARLGGFDLLELADATHMLPLERPRAIARATLGFLGLHAVA
ncbi:MAG: alpha/beta hydrolase [Proteobacteria bacterium]|nr:alpha/beta hydrolase [Pseudomonadota bacterium]